MIKYIIISAILNLMLIGCIAFYAHLIKSGAIMTYNDGSVYQCKRIQ